MHLSSTATSSPSRVDTACRTCRNARSGRAVAQRGAVRACWAAGRGPAGAADTRDPMRDPRREAAGARVVVCEHWVAEIPAQAVRAAGERVLRRETERGEERARLILRRVGSSDGTAGGSARIVLALALLSGFSPSSDTRQPHARAALCAETTPALARCPSGRACGLPRACWVGGRTEVSFLSFGTRHERHTSRNYRKGSTRNAVGGERAGPGRVIGTTGDFPSSRAPRMSPSP